MEACYVSMLDCPRVPKLVRSLLRALGERRGEERICLLWLARIRFRNRALLINTINFFLCWAFLSFSLLLYTFGHFFPSFLPLSCTVTNEGQLHIHTHIR